MNWAIDHNRGNRVMRIDPANRCYETQGPSGGASECYIDYKKLDNDSPETPYQIWVSTDDC